MLISEPIYDFDELIRNNLHIHTIHSSCARREMLAEDIVRNAVRNGVQRIAFTDHYNSTDFPIIQKNMELRQAVKELGANIRILYGSELSAYGVGKFLDSIEVNRMLDYRLYAYNHFHVKYWNQPEERTPRGYVEHSIKVLESLFQTDRADCIAHPFVGTYIRCFDDRKLVSKEITDNELGDIMQKGNESGVAWEINIHAVMNDPELCRRYWHIGKEIGVVFHFGTDAHELSVVSTSQYLDLLRNSLA